MRVRRRIANLLIQNCGLRALRGSRLLGLVRGFVDELELQHLRDSHPCQVFRERREMYRYLQGVYLNGHAVDYLEFGVFHGASIRQWASLNQHKESRFFGFDSFEGLPEDWRKGQEKGHFAVGGAAPQINDPRVRFIKGWFEETIPLFVRNFAAKNRLVLHFDADLYGSTMLPLIHFTPFMREGTLLIFDEFYDRDHEFKAFMDWQRIYKKNFRIAAQMERYGRICAELLSSPLQRDEHASAA